MTWQSCEINQKQLLHRNKGKETEQHGQKTLPIHSHAYGGQPEPAQMLTTSRSTELLTCRGKIWENKSREDDGGR